LLRTSNPRRALLWISLLASLICGCRARHAASDPLPATQPCPNLTAPRTLNDHGRTAVEIQVPMTVDVDGAPNAYAPPGKPALDILEHALAPAVRGKPREVVGYMTEYDGGPPTIQREDDPYPGYYVSQTDFADQDNQRMEDPRRYVDATRINYVVLGKVATNSGVKLGDFAVVRSCGTNQSAYAIVGDSGNPNGSEGSLALVQALGYPFTNGIDRSVDNREIVIRYFPNSNPQHQFFKTQTALDEAAKQLGLTK